MTDILYRSRRIEVRRVAAGDGRRQVVTFDSHHVERGFKRPGFGEGFFAGEGITAIHVLSYGNDWFQYPEMAGVLTMIQQHCAGSERLLAYGSSMGGYAAIRFAGEIGADTALALSPQYSLDPRKVRFETRWAQDRRRLRFIHDGPITAGSHILLAFDSALAPDRRHAELWAAETKVELLPLPFGGHPVGAFLNEVNLLRPLVLTALDGSFDAERFLRSVRSRRSASAHWLATLAERQPPSRPRLAVDLARRAVEIAPGHAAMHDALARRLAAAGCFDDAVTAHERALAIEPVPDYLWGLTKTLFAAGDLAGALAVARQLQKLAPKTAGYHAWAAKIREKQGDLRGTLVELRKALRHDRSNRAYRFMIRGLRWRLFVGRWRRILLRR